MSAQRAYQLRPWLVRALIPAAHIGSYVLYRRMVPTYVGRSDTDPRRRLLEHAAAGRGDYFTFDVHPSSWHAFQVECSLYHGVEGHLGNRIHPDVPSFTDSQCPFCRAQLHQVLDNRLVPNL